MNTMDTLDADTRRTRVVVLGAGYAGLTAAARLARRVRPEDVTVDRERSARRPRRTGPEPSGG